MPNRMLRLRDPIHGYIPVTAIEKPLLDHPITQRLRWVAQSGLAQYVFPEVRTSRFTHSLGAMHLASRFLLGILLNAEPNVKSRLEQEFIEVVKEADPDVKLSEATVQDLQRQGLIASTAVDSHAVAATVVVEQALRLAALFHDLGHLPFSHNFEYVVRELVNEAPIPNDFAHLGLGKQPHEQVGYSMVSLLQRSVYQGLTATTLRDAVSPAFKLARRIMAADAPPRLGTETARSILLLHALVDGELDVDRSDYLLRDARSYGFDYITFDLERLITGLTIHETDDGDLTVAVLPQGQPAAESFLLARYRIYQWGVFHHKVVQVGKALEMVTAEVLGEAFPKSTHRLHAFATEVATLANPDASGREQALESFAEHDDVWWLGELRAHAAPSPMRELVLARRPGPVSLWKRVSEFPGGPAAVEALNRGLPQRGDLEAEQAWQQLEHDLRQHHGVILGRVRFTPVRIDPATNQSLLRVGTTMAESRPLSELSPLISALPDAWTTDLQVFAFTEQHVDDRAGLADTVVQKMMATIA